MACSETQLPMPFVLFAALPRRIRRCKPRAWKLWCCSCTSLALPLFSSAWTASSPPPSATLTRDPYADLLTSLRADRAVLSRVYRPLSVMPMAASAVEQAQKNRASQETQLVMAWAVVGGTMGAPSVDWNDWVLQFMLMEFKESRSSALAACQDVAAIYPSLAQTLSRLPLCRAGVSCDWSSSRRWPRALSA